jgi:hypothetical protein
LTARRGRVHIAVLGEPPPGIDVSAFSGRFRRLTFGYLPVLDRWSHLGMTVRGVLDCWRDLDSGTVDDGAYAQRLEEAPPLAAALAGSSWLRAGGLRRPASRLLEAIDRTLPAPPPIVEYLRARQPALLIVAPMFAIGSFATDYLRAANELGIPTVALPARWDDLTRGGLAHAQPDCVALWNREQRQQAVEILQMSTRRTAVIGACLPLDVAGRVTTTREAFCQRHGLDPGRAVVILTGAAGQVDWIRRWVDHLRGSTEPRLRAAAVIVYWPPPAGVQQQDHPHLRDVVVLPRTDTEPRQYAFEIAEALHHADIVVARDMTLVLEAAAQARPLVALLPPEVADPELARFCASLGAARGWPRVATDLDTQDAAIAAALRNRLDRAGQAAARTIVRPHGPDLSPGFLMWVRLFAEVVDRRADPRPVPRWTPWLRSLLAPLASLAATRVARLPAHREQRDRARVLVGAPSASSLFLHQPILRVLAERGHHLSLVFTARRDRTMDEYSRIKCDVPNVVQAGAMMPPEGLWAAVSKTLFGLSAYLSMLERRRGSQVPAWLVRLGLTALPAGARPIARLARQSGSLPRSLRRIVRRFDRAIPPSAEAYDLLRQRTPDVLLVLPDSDVVTALDSAPTQGDLIRAASSLGIPAVSIAAGPDAQIHATLLQSNPSLALVWNEAQRKTVMRDLGGSRDAVMAMGAAQLERCLDEPPLLTDDEFRARLGLPPGPFAFFAGSVGVLSEPRREVDLVRRWVASLRESANPVLRDLPVLIRQPVHSPRWRTLDFTGLGPVVFCPRRYERSGELDVVLLAESVRYAAVTIGIDGLSLSMAAAMGKPAIAVSRADATTASDEAPLEVLWKTPGSPVSLADSLEDLNRRLRTALDASPATAARALDPIVRSPTGERTSALIADAIERQARRSQRRAHSRVPVGARMMRVPLLLSAGAVNLMGRLVTLGRG